MNDGWNQIEGFTDDFAVDPKNPRVEVTTRYSKEENDMANIKTLKDLAPGTVFDAGPIDVRVLDHMTNGTTLLIADKAVAWRPFSLEPLKTRPEEAPTPYPNDFSLSYLKDELNGPFLAASDAAGRPDPFREHRGSGLSLADHRGGFATAQRRRSPSPEPV